MNKLNNYVPILVSKEGEFKAIHHLSNKGLSRLTPLFDIHRLPLKSEKNLDEHLEKILENFYKYCGNFLFMLDYSRINLSWRMSSGEHPLSYLCSNL